MELVKGSTLADRLATGALPLEKVLAIARREAVGHWLLVEAPAYFLREAHGFNSGHGRMPAVATGANAARPGRPGAPRLCVHRHHLVQADFVPHADEISAEYQEGSVKNVMMHDGSWVKFRKLAKDYDPTNRDAAYAHIREHQQKGEVVTGLLYISPDSKDVHDQNDTVPGPLYNLPHAQLCPGNDALQKTIDHI